MRVRVLALSLGAVAVTVAAASCGVSGSGAFKALNRDDVQRSGLLDTTTTTTTTTIATTTIPATTPPTILETTTTLAVEPIEAYFISGNRLTPVTKNVARPAGPNSALEFLTSGPPAGDAGIGLRTAIPSDIVVGVEQSGGVATVDLLTTSVQAIAADQLPLAFGQLVLTLELRGIGSVKFRADGVDLAVPKGDGSITTPGTPVTFDDYRSLVAQ